ncbi:precorrin-2 C(20)-methyltransferase [Oscillibacter valericigenes]|nr:precorrin-2 C(20)-methyltransferase [Oscillibacter valericigenes]
MSRGGKLWGVGVGPGDPELLTMKAVRVLREADVVMVPDTSKTEKTALNIAKDYLDGKELVFVKTPMVRDKAVVDAAYEEAAGKIAALLDQGKQVVFLTLGDPTVYSTYMYIHEKVLRQGYEVEVVPGVTSFCAAAARLNISLCQGSEPLLVIPASHDQEALLDVPANKVFMKAGRSILELRQTLADRGMLEGASMVENCGMANERVYPNFAELKEPSGYFSLVIAKGGKS